MSSGGSSAPPPSTTTVQQNTIAPEASPYYSTLLGQASALTDINQNPWLSYSGDRIAGFSPLQEQAFANLEGAQLPWQTFDASNMAWNTANQAQMYQNYQPDQFYNQYYSPQFQGMGFGYQNINDPYLQNYQMQSALMNYNPNLQNFYGTAATGQFDPRLQDFAMQAAMAQGAQGQAATGSYNPFLQNYYMQGAQGGYNPNLQNFAMQAAQNQWLQNPASQIYNYQMGPATQVGTDKWIDPGTAQSYMSPYIQQALDPTMAQMQRQADLRQRDLSGQAQQAGAYGGYRQGIQLAEEQRNTERAKADTYAQGLQQAYTSAQQGYGTDAARALQAGMANQGANLAAGTSNLQALLQSQGLRAQTGLESILANQQAQQQAGLANQAGQYATQQLGAGIGSQFGLQNLANLQQAGLANQQAGLGVQQLGTQTGLQTYLQNLANQQQMGLANLGNTQQANLANQQAQMQAGLANQAGQYQTQQLGAQTGLQSYLQNLANQQQMALANQQAGLGVQQLGANLGWNTAQQNQQAQQAANLANLQALLGVQQLGSGYNMQGQLANQAAGLQTQQYGLQQLLAQNAQNLANAQNYAQFGTQADQLSEASRQFGANLGLQGLNTSLGAAGLLGGMGQQQYSQMLGLNQAQQLAGAQQQQQYQQYLSNLYQNFLSQQNWPYQNLGFLSDIIGRPLQNQTTSMYQAPATMGQNLLGLGLGAYGLSGLFGGRKEGGVVKAAKGGLMEGASDQQLQNWRREAYRRPPTFKGLAALDETEDRGALRNAYPIPPETLLALAPENMPGLPQLPAPNMGGFKEGGIVGYQQGGTPYSLQNLTPRYQPESSAFERFQRWILPQTPQAAAERRETQGRFFKEIGEASRQFGVNLGLQGLNTSLEAATFVPRALGWMDPATTPTATTTPAGIQALASESAALQYGSPPTNRAIGNTITDPMPPRAGEQRMLPGILAALAAKKQDSKKNREAKEVVKEAQALNKGFEFTLPPDLETKKDSNALYADLQDLRKKIAADNPMQARRDEYADKLERHKEQDPHAAAIAAAQAIIGMAPQRGISGLIGNLATGAAAAGAGQLKREEQHDARAEKLLQLDMALYTGDTKLAGQLQEQLIKLGMERDKVKMHAWEVKQIVKERAHASAEATAAKREGDMLAYKASMAKVAAINSEFKRAAVEQRDLAELNKRVMESTKRFEKLFEGNPEYMFKPEKLGIDSRRSALEEVANSQKSTRLGSLAQQMLDEFNSGHSGPLVRRAGVLTRSP